MRGATAPITRRRARKTFPRRGFHDGRACGIPARPFSLSRAQYRVACVDGAFAERFLDVTGVTPVRYLTEMRMRLAADWISREGVPIELEAVVGTRGNS